MRPEDRDLAHLWDMLEASQRALRFASGYDLESFLTDDMVQAAIERTVEIVGEAARGVSPEFQATHLAIPWRRITGQRHVLAHDYGEIDQARMWALVSDHLPTLVAQLESLVRELSGQSEGA
jgi:uncharacterized protein with HEPN domain